MLEFSAISSGSNGNCFYVRNSETNTAVLIDAGVSMKKVTGRLLEINRSISEVKALFITHEHSDHISGADVLSRHLNIPVFATAKTFKSSFICKREYQNEIKSNEIIDIGGLKIEAFKKSHGAADPVSYNIIKNNKKISIITDTGRACENVSTHINESNILCLESNHDLEMLQNGHYPWFLKKWIASDTGHLSNRQSALAVLEHASTKLKRVVLSHLSANNNTPEHAMNAYRQLIKERHDIRPEITVSTRHEITPIMKV